MSSRVLPVLALFFLAPGCAAAGPSRVGASQPGGADPLQQQTAESLFKRGEQSAEHGDSVRAEQYIELAIDRGYDRGRALPILLSVCLSSGRLRAALNYAEPELRLRPDDAELRYLVASIYLGLSQRDQARDELEQLLRQDSHQPAALFLLGVLEADEFGDDVSARAHFERYLVEAPSGKHAPEARMRLSGLAARASAASRNGLQTAADGRMPPYEPYVPSPAVMIVPAPRPQAIQADGEEGGWR